jgi:hypothetical protein
MTLQDAIKSKKEFRLKGSDEISQWYDTTMCSLQVSIYMLKRYCQINGSYYELTTSRP